MRKQKRGKVWRTTRAFEAGGKAVEILKGAGRGDANVAVERGENKKIVAHSVGEKPGLFYEGLLRQRGWVGVRRKRRSASIDRSRQAA